MEFKKHDFVELEYTGRLDDGTVFDTTDEKIAKESGLYRQNASYGPVVICLGENHLLPGLEKEIIGKGIQEFKKPVQPEEGFGKKNAKLLRLIPLKVFKKQEVQPYPGLEVNVDDSYGIVKTVSGGRVIVDFNHPLSGKVLDYQVKVIRQVTDVKEKAAAVFKTEFGFSPEISVEGKILTIMESKLPDEVLEAIKKRVLELVPELSDVKKGAKKEAEPEKKAVKSDKN